MWCRACQQEVPGIPSPQDGTIRCARCHASVSSRIDPAGAITPPHAGGRDTASTANVSGDVRPAIHPASPTFFQSWDLDEDLRTAEQLARNLRIHARHHVPLPANEVAPVQATSSAHATDSLPSLANRHRALRFVSRTLLGASLVLFAAGAALAAWSVFRGNPMTWRIGMPLALAGEVGLILSLAAHLLGDSQRDRAAGEVLVQLDRQVHRLRDSAIPTATSAGRETASPHLLLADLKAQLELLSRRLHDEE